MTVRTPSLRELRRNRPDNVTILPTAAARQVEQRYGRDYGKAKRALVESQTAAFPYKPPWAREWERAEASPVLKADVPPFDPSNPKHLRAWESLWEIGRRALQLDSD